MKKHFTPVKSADRVFDIFEEIVKHSGGLTIHELGQQLDIASSSIHGLVHTMLNRKYLNMDESRNLSLGIKFFEFANLFSQHPLLTFAKPLMKEIAAKINENVHLAILDGLDVVFIACEETTHPIRYHVQIGQPQKAHITGTGKMLLAKYSNQAIRELYKSYPFVKYTENTICSAEALVEELDEVRSNGYSIDNGEGFEGAKCFAAPIYDKNHQMISSISISIPYARSDSERESELIELIVTSAKRLSNFVQ